MGQFTTFGMQRTEQQQLNESESDDELAKDEKLDKEEEEDLGPDDSEIKNTMSDIKRQIGLIAVTFPRTHVPDVSTLFDNDPDSFYLLSRQAEEGRRRGTREGRTDDTYNGSSIKTAEYLRLQSTLLLLASLNPKYLLRGMLVTAVRDWVFYSNVLDKMFGMDSRVYWAQTWSIYSRGQFIPLPILAPGS